MEITVIFLGFSDLEHDRGTGDETDSNSEKNYESSSSR